MAGTAPQDWQVLKRELILRFGDPNLEDNKREELAALSKGMAAQELRSKLERIFVHLPNLAEEERVWHLRDKLRSTTRYVFEQHQPKKLLEAYALAEMVERAATLSGTGGVAQEISRTPAFAQFRPRAAPWSGGREQRSVPMALHAMQDVRQAREPLTEKEREDLIKNNGCFLCRMHNAGHGSRDCPPRTSRPRPVIGRGRASS